MNKTRCTYVNGYHCDCYNRGVCESITYCTYQDDRGMIEKIERLRKRIKELEVENAKLKIEVAQARASRDMWAEIPRLVMKTEDALKYLSKE